jgi:hypothetical protein
MFTVDVQLSFNDRSAIISIMLNLSEQMRPKQFSDEENNLSRRWPIDQLESFYSISAQQDIFLFASDFNCSLIAHENEQMNIFCEVKKDSDVARELLRALVALHPLFGYACLYEERLYSNRVVTKQGINTVESWVGRNIEKYIPGLYWWTLLPENLMERHGVPLDRLKMCALQHIEMGDGLHLFRFYDRPEEWREAFNRSRVRLSLPGIFDVEKIRPKMEDAQTFLNLIGIVQDWN